MFFMNVYEGDIDKNCTYYVCTYVYSDYCNINIYPENITFFQANAMPSWVWEDFE